MTTAPQFLNALVPRETICLLEAYVDLLIAANARQNLVARSTIEFLWTRHILDSLQLLPMAEEGRWLDVGSGAGLPGLVVAMARPQPILLVEPRARRADFLREVAARLGLDHVTVAQARVEALPAADARVISARAVAGLTELFQGGMAHAAADCLWLLPKGRGAVEELAAARRTWQGDFRLIPSLTDPEASIVMARDVHPVAARVTARQARR